MTEPSDLMESLPDEPCVEPIDPLKSIAVFGIYDVQAGDGP